MIPASGTPDLPALARGDETAWTELVRMFGPRLLAVARGLLRDDAAAEDCVQSAYLQALRNFAGFEGRSAVGTWLHRIVVNAALVVLRSRRRKPEEPIEPLLPVFDRSGYRAAVGPVARDPEELAGRAEATEILRSAIDLLPESYRTVLVLRDLEEMENQDVATLLGDTPNAVKVRLHRARSALKTLVEMPKAEIRISRVSEVCRWVLGAPARAVPLVITCRQFEDFIMDFLEGSLAPVHRRRFEMHLRTCRECRQYLMRYRATLAMAHAAGAADPTAAVPRALLRAIAGALGDKKADPLAGER